MILGPVGWAFMGYGGGSGGAGEPFEFQGQEFQPRVQNGQTLFFTQLNGDEVGFYHDPYTIETLEVSEDFLSRYKQSDSLYVITGTNQSIGQLEEMFMIMVDDVSRFTAKDGIRASTQEQLFNDNIEVKTCEGIEEDEVGLRYTRNPGNESLIYPTNTSGCYALNGDQFELLQTRDYLVMAGNRLI